MGSNDWGISDHNVILIQMMWDEIVGVNEDVCRWISKDVDWEGYMSDLMESAAENARFINDKMNVDEMLENVMKWILSANDRWLKRHKPKLARKLVWTEELERLKKVRKCRRAISMRGKMMTGKERMRGRMNIDERELSIRSVYGDRKRQTGNSLWVREIIRIRGVRYIECAWKNIGVTC